MVKKFLLLLFGQTVIAALAYLVQNSINLLLVLALAGIIFLVGLTTSIRLFRIHAILLPLVMAILGGPIFAFANPVPYNPNRLRHPVRDEVLVALAGPACNFVQAVVGAIVFRILFGVAFGQTAPSEAILLALRILSSYVYLNLMLMFFNLIPLPPLDGSAIISPFLRGKARGAYYQIQRYAMPILLVAMYLLPSVLGFNPLSMYLKATAGNLSDLMLGF